MTGELPGGWTVNDLARIARYVARRQFGLLIDLEEAADIAAVAIVERLFTDPPPTSSDLFTVARNALGIANAKEATSKGLDRATQTDRPRFVAYWRGSSALASPFEDRVVEELAAQQVWAALSDRHRETLQLLITYGTSEAARAAVGLTAKGWHTRLARARTAARVLWFYPDEPARHWARDIPGLERNPKHRHRTMNMLAERKRRTAKAA